MDNLPTNKKLVIRLDRLNLDDLRKKQFKIQDKVIKIKKIGTDICEFKS